jgi:hypothetical protein
MRRSLWLCFVLILGLAPAPAPVQAAADVAASNCSLGITNGSAGPDQAFSAFSVFLYVDPAQCATCTAPGVVQITQVHVPYCGGNNSVRLTVTPLAAVSDPVNPALLRPDASQSLGPSVTFDATFICVGGFVFRTLSLPSPVSIDRPCYVRVSLRVLTSPLAQAPTTEFDNFSCHPGFSYVSWPEGAPIQPSCALFKGDVAWWFTSSCGSVVPIRTSDWGRLKIRYR